MNLDELSHELRALMKCYPSFVTRSHGALAAGEIPVFVFHTVVVSALEEQLRYLKHNDYRALSLSEFLDTVAGRRKPGEREVLLTFDDARSSFWLYGFPLLKKYGFNAIVFAITGWTPHRSARPSLEDVWAGRIKEVELDHYDPDDAGVCSWEELAIMHASGIVTVDSHSHLHRRVFNGRELLSVIAADDDFSPSRAVHSAYLDCGQPVLDQEISDFVGLPLFPDRSLFDQGLAIEINQDALGNFQERARGLLAHGHVTASGLRELRGALPGSALEEIPPEVMRAKMWEEIATAREQLREHLGDQKAGRTLCLPYTEGGVDVVDAAKQLGLEALFWGVSVTCKVNRPGQDPMHLVRLKNDFICRLPGAGRQSLAAVYARKASKRITGVRPY